MHWAHILLTVQMRGTSGLAWLTRTRRMRGQPKGKPRPLSYTSACCLTFDAGFATCDGLHWIALAATAKTPCASTTMNSNAVISRTSPSF